MSGIQVCGNISGGSITGNRISDISRTTPPAGAATAFCSTRATTASNVTVSNNFISDVASQGFAGVNVVDNGYGIVVNSGGGYSILANSILPQHRSGGRDRHHRRG